MLFVSNYAFGQKCLFFVKNVGLTKGDRVVSDTLTAWGYEVTPALCTTSGFFSSDSLAAYDFMVASESMGSGDLKPLRTIPLPFVNLEGWMVRRSAMNWSVQDPNNEVPQPVRIADTIGHPLAGNLSKPQ